VEGVVEICDRLLMKLVQGAHDVQQILQQVPSTGRHLDESMNENVEDRKEAQTDVAVVNWHVRMLRLKASHHLQTLVEKTLGIFLVETQMFFVPVVLHPVLSRHIFDEVVDPRSELRRLQNSKNYEEAHLRFIGFVVSEGEEEDESIERENVVLPNHVIEDFAVFGQLRVLTRHGRRKMTHQVVGECP